MDTHRGVGVKYLAITLQGDGISDTPKANTSKQTEFTENSVRVQGYGKTNGEGRSTCINADPVGISHSLLL